MPELALDHEQRDAFVRHLDRVRMAKLMWREPAPDSGLDRQAVQRQRAAEGDHDRPAVGPSITHSSAPTGNSMRCSSHGWSCCHPHRSMPTWRRLPPLPSADPSSLYELAGLDAGQPPARTRLPGPHSPGRGPARSCSSRSCFS